MTGICTDGKTGTSIRRLIREGEEEHVRLAVHDISINIYC